LQLADEPSRKAVELDDSSSDAHVARGNALATAWKWSAVEPEFRRAIELNPNNANAHYFYAFNYLMPTNHLDEALEQFRLALALDPLAAIVKTNYALTLMDAHKYPEAREQFDQIIESDPRFGPALFYLSQMEATHVQWAEAISALQKTGVGEATSGRSWSPRTRKVTPISWRLPATARCRRTQRSPTRLREIATKRSRDSKKLTRTGTTSSPLSSASLPSTI